MTAFQSSSALVINCTLFVLNKTLLAIYTQSNWMGIALTFHNFQFTKLKLHQSILVTKSYKETKFQVDTFLYRQWVMDYQVETIVKII